MAKLFDLSKGYLPVVLVAAMIASGASVSYWLSSMTNSVEHNTREIVEISTKLEVLPEMTTDIALIKYRLGIEGKDGKDSKPTAMIPYRNNLD